MHVHLVLVGSLFFWPLLGVDPLPGRVAYPFRLLMVVLTLPFHAFLGVTIMQQTSLIGGSWYPDLHRVLPWLPDAAADQHLAGGILWGVGRPDRAAVLRGAVRAVGAQLDAGGRPRGPSARPAGGAGERRGDG